MAAAFLHALLSFTQLLLTTQLSFKLINGSHDQDLQQSNFNGERRKHYIVHMDSSNFKPQPFTSQETWYSSLMLSSSLSSSSLASSPKLVYTYENSMNGFSALLSEDHLHQLKRHPGFISAFADSFGTIQTTHTYKFLGLDEASGVWPASKFGEDVIIGVIDTGVWPESKSFRDDNMSEVPKRWKGRCEPGKSFKVSNCNKKLIGVRFFNKGILVENPDLNNSTNSARDISGHGTHTASTAAGSFVPGASYFGYAPGIARGMAPRARIAVYKVCWKEASPCLTASDTLAAIDQAIADGVDIISLSIAFRLSQLHENPIAIGTFAAMEKGIFVAAAAGNGILGFYQRVLNGDPWIVTVTAANFDRIFSGVVTLGNGVTLTGSSLYIGNTSALRRTNKIPLYYNSSISTSFCDSVDAMKENNVTKKVVVCDFITDGLGVRSITDVVSSGGGVGALLLGTDRPYFMDQKDYEIPCAVLDPNDSLIVRRYLNTSKNPTISFQFGKTIFGRKPAPTLARYAQRGPSYGSQTVMKPDLMAPGTMVLAAESPKVSVITVQGKELFSHFNLHVGTSMAAPHVSGVAALIKSVHPEWSPAAIRSAMMTTADTLDNTGQPIKDSVSFTTATALQMGSGHINPTKAMDPGLVYDVDRMDYLKFLCALNYTREEFMTVARNSTEYGICTTTSSKELFNLNYPSFIALYDVNQTRVVHKFKRTLTNVRHGGFIYTASLMSMKGFRVSVRPLRLVFGKKGDEGSFVLTMEITTPMTDSSLVEGSLTWVDAKRKHMVKSPIVATTIKEDSGDDDD